MSIVRGERPESGWYALDKRISEDSRLSWVARGVLVFLLGKPDHWKVSVEHLRRQTEGARIRTGRDGIYAVLAELQACGYLTATQARHDDGTLGPIEYLVREAPPLPAQPDTAGPLPAQPDTAKPTLVKTDNPARTDTNQGARKRAVEGEAFPTPEWVPRELWLEWLQVRRKLRAPATDRALALALRDLTEFRAAGEDPTAVLELAIARGWRGLFSTNRGNTHGTGFNGGRESEAERVERINREHDERERRESGGR